MLSLILVCWQVDGGTAEIVCAGGDDDDDDDDKNDDDDDYDNNNDYDLIYAVYLTHINNAFSQSILKRSMSMGNLAAMAEAAAATAGDADVAVEGDAPSDVGGGVGLSASVGGLQRRKGGAQA